MWKPMVSNVNGIRSSSDTKEQADQKQPPQQQTDKPEGQSQPNVRHIPIFVEGRDEPLLNTKVNRSSSNDPDMGARQQSPSMTDLPRPGTIFSRVKDIPVRTSVSDFQTTNADRAASPSRAMPIKVVHTASQSESHAGASSPRQAGGFTQAEVHKSGSRERTIPIKIEHTNTNSPKDTQQADEPPMQTRRQYQQQQSARSQQAAQSPFSQQSQQQRPTNDDVDSKSPLPQQQPSPAVQQSLDAITKIQKIQKDVLELMNRVEQFKGGARTNKEYLYLDEMLTQNLLKLDTIDADGKDNIKAARKEAIKCINKCISVLEAKTDPANCIESGDEQIEQRQQSQAANS